MRTQPLRFKFTAPAGRLVQRQKSLRQAITEPDDSVIPQHSPFHFSEAVSALLVLLAGLVTQSVCGQSPGLAWTTNIGARLFAVDAQTNVYANVGGAVIQLTSAGVPTQTNTICPVPGIARRDGI